MGDESSLFLFPFSSCLFLLSAQADLFVPGFQQNLFLPKDNIAPPLIVDEYYACFRDYFSLKRLLGNKPVKTLRQRKLER